jgi:NAD(P)-dependent dehydrogenase (short-subunit alcohol dehydrogenase family)
MSDHSPRVVVITGASQGIGASLVTAYRKLGYAVLGTSRTIAPSEDPMITTIQGDIATADAAERVTRHAIDRFGRIDTLINNAGVFGPSDSRSTPMRITT